MKTCTKCKETKDLSCFSKHRKAKDGLYYYCKTCVLHKNAKLYAKRKAFQPWITHLNDLPDLKPTPEVLMYVSIAQLAEIEATYATLRNRTK